MTVKAYAVHANKTIKSVQSVPVRSIDDGRFASGQMGGYEFFRNRNRTMTTQTPIRRFFHEIYISKWGQHGVT
jgi:hypothetical protein